MITKNDIKDIYSLSPLQEGILFHHMMGTESGQYVEQVLLEINGELNLDLFEHSFNDLIRKYDVFRTIFMFGKGKKNLQGVLKERKVSILFEDISNLEHEKVNRYIENIRIKNAKRGFDLRKEISTRVTVFKKGHDLYHVLWEFHHIIIDGWCLPIVFKDFFSLYSSHLQGKEISFSPTRPYADYIKWLQKRDVEAAGKYWGGYLEGDISKSQVPSSAYYRSPGYEQGIYEMEFTAAECTRLGDLTKKQHITTNSFFQTVWGVLLGKYNETTDVVFGTVVSGRPADLPGVESMVGLFINNIPVRLTFDQSEKFIHVAKKIQNEFMESLQYGYLSLSEIQSYSKSRNDLVNHILVFENYPYDNNLNTFIRQLGLNISLDKASITEQTNYDFEIVIEDSDNIKLKFRYNKHVYDEKAVARIGEQLLSIAKQVIDNPNILVGDFDILTYEQKREITTTFNDTKAENDLTKTLHQLFEEKAVEYPDEEAVIFGDLSLTYGELNARSNQLARYLRDQDVASETIVAIVTERKLDMIIAIMGVLKAGGAYLPIDPNYPEERIQYILEDSKASLILTQSAIHKNIKTCRDIICLDDANIYAGDNTSLDNVSSPNNLAYVIYTSGSTGKPKGVMIEHKAVVNRLIWMQNRYKLNQNDTILQKTTFTFDVSVWELFLWFFGGAKLCFLEPNMEKDAEQIVNIIHEKKITTIHFVPSMFSMFLNYVNHKGAVDGTVSVRNQITSLKRVFTSGEELLASQANLFRQTVGAANKIKLINLYGPTEAAIDITYFDCDSVAEELLKVPIGKPIDNMKVYILNEDMEPVAVGMTGELWIAGVALARGYINNEALTKEKFILNPCNAEERLYRTGDLARWLSDGNIEYLGRIDHQVKIRGFRIEVGEIEHLLLNHLHIKEVVVIPRRKSDGDNFLCAYMVLDHFVTVNELRTYLLTYVPDYMVPEHFVKMDSMPVNSNGKLDRKRLPEVNTNLSVGTQYFEPTNEIEMKMVKLWKEVLGYDSEISIEDNFFQLGGHSLKAGNLISIINKEFQVNLQLKLVFQYPTIKGLAEQIIYANKHTYHEIQPVEERGYYPTSSAQKRVFIINRMEDTLTSYNMPGAIVLEGEIDLNRLEDVFNNLIDRHESLRTSFEIREGEPVQIISKSVQFEIECFEVDETKLDEWIFNYIRPFQFHIPPLFRVGIAKLTSTRHLLLMDMHHIITDGISLNILIKEISSLYNGKDLPRPKIQYKDFTVWHNEFLNSKQIREEESYWLSVFKGDIPDLNMPTDYARPAIRNYEGDMIYMELGDELTKQLEKFTIDSGTTMFMLLLSVFNILLFKYTGSEDIVVGIPIAGRIQPELNEVIGMFVNTLPMRNKTEGHKTFKELLALVSENALKAFQNQNYQFETLVNKLGIHGNKRRNPLFDSMFIMQNIDKQEIRLGNARLTPYQIKEMTSKFDFKLEAYELNGVLNLSLDYATDLYKMETMQGFLDNYASVVRSILENPYIRLCDIELISENNKKTMLHDFNEELEG